VSHCLALIDCVARVWSRVQSYVEYQRLVEQLESMEKRYKARQTQLQRAANTFAEQLELERSEQRLKFESALRAKNAQIARFKAELDALLQQVVGAGGPGAAASLSAAVGEGFPTSAGAESATAASHS
jgi:hypothetical protein